MFQAFDKNGSIVGPIPVGGLHSATLCSEQHQHYDSDLKLIYERKWLPSGANPEKKCSEEGKEIQGHSPKIYHIKNLYAI